MGKRYYCEFCDKSIPSDVESRRKHNEGASHLTNRALYYAKYKGEFGTEENADIGDTI